MASVKDTRRIRQHVRSTFSGHCVYLIARHLRAGIHWDVLDGHTEEGRWGRHQPRVFHR